MSERTADADMVREYLRRWDCPYRDAVDPGMHSGCEFCADKEDVLAALDRLVARNQQLQEALAASEAAHLRVVANESNHYDRYWAPPPEPLTDEYLDETEAKMREALIDVFCDDAAAIMLTLIAEIRRLR